MSTLSDCDVRVLNSELEGLLQMTGLQESTFDEHNWSGHGRHVEFRTDERTPDDLLKVIKNLGHGSCGYVQKVLYKQVPLARKTMLVHRRQTLQTLMQEVKFLHELRHPHIVQLVGTYLQGRRFSMLIYPAASFSLPEFYALLRRGHEPDPRYDHVQNRGSEKLTYFPGCLAHALRYIHACNIMHMDIKPSNILVHRIRGWTPGYERHHWEFNPYRVYLCDFGISRDFAVGAHSQTGASPGMTPVYAAPEVAGFSAHGRAADVFSLGCVFLEMATVLLDPSPGDALDRFVAHRCASNKAVGDRSFHANLGAVTEWIRLLRASDRPNLLPSNILGTIEQMLNAEPAARPTAAEISALIPSSRCCEGSREPFREETQTCVICRDFSPEGGIVCDNCFRYVSREAEGHTARKARP